MSKELLFWIVCLFWLLGGIGSNQTNAPRWWGWGRDILLLILILLLGWSVYGDPIQ